MGFGKTGFSLKNFLKSLTVLMAFTLFSGLYTQSVQAQQPDIRMELEAETVLNQAQVVDIRSLSFDPDGRGTRIVNLYLENNSTSPQGNLFLDIRLESQRHGTLLTHNQVRIRSFTLQAGQSTYASNNDIAQGRLPGVDNNLIFSSRWTSSGRALLNRLEGRTSMPGDVYILNVELYQGTTLLASASESIGDDLLEDDLELMLLMPGDIAGTDEVITNSLPYFRWDGPQEVTYRVIVVEDQPGDDPEYLLSNARNTAPARMGETPNLLDYEMMDFVTDNTSLQYPSTGVQPLQPGNRYYWQVISTVRTAEGSEERESEIWSFRLADQAEEEDEVPVAEVDEELWRYLEAILGPEIAADLSEGEFEMESLELGDQQFTGEMAREELMRIIEKIQEGNARILRE